MAPVLQALAPRLRPRFGRLLTRSLRISGERLVAVPSGAFVSSLTVAVRTFRRAHV